MAPPKGSQFWRRRTKHGRDALFTDPVKLWEAACEYFDWCDANPLISIEFLGKDAKQKKVPKMRAFTMRALCLHLGLNETYFRDFKKRLKKTAKDIAFLDVITRIEDTIFVQKFEGAAAGFLRENLIARELGIIDKQIVEAKVEGEMQHKHSGKLEVTVRNSGVPLARKEADIDAKR